MNSSEVWDLAEDERHGVRVGVLGLNGVGREVHVVVEGNEDDNDKVGIQRQDSVGRDVHVAVVVVGDMMFDSVEV